MLHNGNLIFLVLLYFTMHIHVRWFFPCTCAWHDRDSL